MAQTIRKSDLTDIEIYNGIYSVITETGFTKPQLKFLRSYLYMVRTYLQFELIKESKFVNKLKNTLRKTTPSNYHHIYRNIVNILMNDLNELNFSEKAYSWSLLHSLRDEFKEDALAYILNTPDDIYYKWKEGISNISFRHIAKTKLRANGLNVNPHSVFMINEEIKIKDKSLRALARTSSFIQESELYLLNIKDGTAQYSKNRIDDILVASTFAKSAGHLAKIIEGLDVNTK